MTKNLTTEAQRFHRDARGGLSAAGQSGLFSVKLYGISVSLR